MHPLRKQRLYIILSIVFGTSLAVYLVIKGLSESVDLFYSPSQLQNQEIAINQKVRVGGMVKSGSINKDKNTLKISFVITDFEKDLLIEYRGILPDLFSEDAGVGLKGPRFACMSCLARPQEFHTRYRPPLFQEIMKNMTSTIVS